MAPTKEPKSAAFLPLTWRASQGAPILVSSWNQSLMRRLACLLIFLVISLTFSLSVAAKTSGCFDNKRFCFELTPSSSSLYLVTVQRKVALPVALTLYSDTLFQIPTGEDALQSKAHVNAFLSTDEAIPLGVVKDTHAFWQSMRVKWTVGRIDATHDNAYTYLSPLQPAGEYRIVQGFNGSYSHSGASRYALDFAAPVGTPVLAARDGVVIDTKDDGNQGGPSTRFAKHANYVVILHSDGTTGEYYHLKYKGVAVTRGQSVQQGQLIGYSGNTGFSSLPHLHFGIYVAKFHGKYVSVPFSLTKTSAGNTH